MKEVFNFYISPSHAWLKVEKELLKELKIENKISLYSYQNGEYAYLEEDCDAYTFIKAWEKASKKAWDSNKNMKCIYYDNYNPIKSYRPYK